MPLEKDGFCSYYKGVGGQTLWTTNIENYTGYLFITGQDLVNNFTAIWISLMYL